MKRLIIAILFLCNFIYSFSQVEKDTCIVYRIYFEINDYTLDTTIEDVIDYIENNDIDSVKICGYSSPDGRKDYNDRLSYNRSIDAYHMAKSIVDDTKINCSTFTYIDLLSLIGNESYYDECEKVILSGKSNYEINKTLKANKTIWGDLTAYYFPMMRYTEIQIYFHREPEMRSYEQIIDTIGVSIQDTVIVSQNEPINDTINEPINEPIYEPINEPIYEPLFNVNTNLLYDASYIPGIGFSPTPNFGIEFYLYDMNTSVGFKYVFPWWKWDSRYDYYQILNLSLEIRKYLKELHEKWYIGLYTNAGIFDLSFNKDDGYQGEGMGMGLTVGYVHRIKDSRWKLTLHGSAGYLYSKFDPYHAHVDLPFNGKYYYDWDDDPYYFRKRSNTLNWIGPTGIGVTLNYDFYHLKKK